MADGFVPPQGVRNNAKRGLELRREFNRGGTEVGVARARDLSNGKSIPLQTIRRMVSYFARHEVDKKGEGWGDASNPSAGYIAWLLWGGDAGKSWANSISERESKKEKSMNLDMASTFAEIVKREKLEDGTLLVYGKATDDSVDIDQQICDAGWLSKAMPEWFKTGGNIREQHSNIAAGVAKELDSKKDGYYISALVVDPVSIKKVETNVLKGFSIGIRSPRIVRDEKAANGRIIDGQIVEVSLVDRPANPNAKLMLAKSDKTNTLIQVEELVEKHGDHDQADHNPHGGEGGGSSSGGGRSDDKVNELAGTVSADSETAQDEIAAVKDALEGEDRAEYEAEGYSDDGVELAESAVNDLDEAQSDLEAAMDAKDEKEHIGHLESAVSKLESAASKMKDSNIGTQKEYPIHEGIKISADQVREYISGLSNKTITAEIAKGEKMEHNKDEAVSEKPSKEQALKRLALARKRISKLEAMCKELGCSDEELKASYGESAEEESEEGPAGSGAEHELEEAEGKKKSKSADAPNDQDAPTEDAEEKKDENSGEEPGLEDDKSLTAIVDEAVKSAMAPILKEIDILKSAKEAAEDTVNKLEGELATAKSKAVAGGPKRTAVKSDTSETDEFMRMATVYRLKAAATEDKVLASGYKELANDFVAKAEAVKNK